MALRPNLFVTVYRNTLYFHTLRTFLRMFAQQKFNKRWLPKIFETIISCEKCRLVLFKHQQETQHKEKALGGYCDRCQNWELLLSRFCPSQGVMSRQAGAALLVTAETFRCFNWTFVSIWPRGKSFTGAGAGSMFLNLSIKYGCKGSIGFHDYGEGPYY